MKLRTRARSFHERARCLVFTWLCLVVTPIVSEYYRDNDGRVNLPLIVIHMVLTRMVTRFPGYTAFIIGQGRRELVNFNCVLHHSKLLIHRENSAFLPCSDGVLVYHNISVYLISELVVERDIDVAHPGPRQLSFSCRTSFQPVQKLRRMLNLNVQLVLPLAPVSLFF